MIRGNELDKVIEDELQLMLMDGYEKSPISNKSLHERLIAKKYISGGLSTLSNPQRKSLINKYISAQISSLNLKTKDQQLFVNRKTKQALTNTNKSFQDEIKTLEQQLHQNTESLIKIIMEVKLISNLCIEHLLAPHLLKKYKNSKK